MSQANDPSGPSPSNIRPPAYQASLIVKPETLTIDNIPYVLGVLVTQMDQNKKDHEEIKEILKEHEECLQIFRFSRCNLIPWLKGNKWVVIVFFSLLSIWVSSLDWLTRWLQWAFFPPRPGP